VSLPAPRPTTPGLDRPTPVPIPVGRELPKISKPDSKPENKPAPKVESKTEAKADTKADTAQVKKQ
jgi:hypothetical protein